MFTFERKANYYETDQMGIVHHSNYIRWFEEARLEMLRVMGLPYKKMEDNGILIPCWMFRAATSTQFALMRRLCLHCAFKTTTVYALKWRMRGTARRLGF